MRGFRLQAEALRALVVFGLAALTTGAQPKPPRIAVENIGRLRVAWTYDTRESTEPAREGGKRPAFEATPAYASGHLYFSTPRGAVIALDADTGGEVWRVELRVRAGANYSDFANRGIALRDDRVYVATVDARLACLERRTGRFCPGFGQNGQIDLTAGLRRTPQYAGEYGVTSPPALYRDLVIVGSSIADNSRARMSSGEVRAFDARSGALRWTFHPLPEHAEAGGANTWSQIVADETSGLVFLPTGSPSPDYFGGQRTDIGEYANAIVALRGTTGEVVWHVQTVHHDLWDYDVASPPVLFASKAGPAVAAGSKTGHVFLLDRLTGKPLFPVDERRVPASDVPGEKAAATQPFPTRPPSLVPQRITAADLWGVNPDDRRACQAILETIRNEGIFTPPSLGGTLSVPGNIGGLHWGGLVWDSSRRLLIAPVNRLPAVMRLIPADRFEQARKAHPKRETTEQRGTPFAMSREFFMSPSGAPCTAPPWGELVAIQVDSGEIAWRATLGDLRQVGLTKADSPTGSPNLGGGAVTDSGILFIGATLDPYLRAFDTRNGREIWKAALPTSARATPLVYTSGRGRHMVVIAAGGHDTSFSKPDTKLVAFALSDQ